MAELLLTPGSFLRLGNHSELTLEEVETTGIRVVLRSGEALIEVLDLNIPIAVRQNGVTAIVNRPGLFEFDVKRAFIVVYDGTAQIGNNETQIIAGKGFGVRIRSLHEFHARPKPDNKLFSWSSLRSEQLSSESAASAQAYPVGVGGWHGPAWYWNPWSASYTYLSASGAVTGPFGWSYYSPGYAPNSIPVPLGGDSRPHASPVLPSSEPARTAPPPPTHAPTVPLTAPGVPQFPNNRF
jgi:hypothetical protein